MTDDSEENKSEVAKREETIPRLWNEREIFKKSLEKGATEGEYVFYEGPPTANGKPGIQPYREPFFSKTLSRAIRRCVLSCASKAGWDTHGLPSKLPVEKEIGSKKQERHRGVWHCEIQREVQKRVFFSISMTGKSSPTASAIGSITNSTYFTFDNDYIDRFGMS